MKNRQSFEDFIREKIGNNKFQYQEQFWEQARIQMQLLKQVNKRKRRRKVVAIFFFLFFGISSYLVWTFNQTPLKDSLAYEKIEKASNSTFSNSSIKKESKRKVHDFEPSKNLNSYEHIQPIKGNKNTSTIQKSRYMIGMSKTQEEHASFGKLKSNSISTPEVEDVNLTLKGEASNKTDARQTKDNKIERLPQLPLQLLNNQIDHNINIENTIRPKKHRPLRALEYWLNLNYGKGLRFSSGIQQMNKMEINLLIGFQFSRRWKVESGLGYSYINGQLPIGVLEQTQQGFIATTTRYKWKLKNIQFINLPIFLNYSSSSKHEYAIGGHFFYRLKTKGEEMVFQNSTLDQEGILIRQEYKDYGSAISNWNLQGSLSYQYRFSKKIKIGLQYRFGLKDLLEDTIFSPGKQERLTFLEFSLKYKL